MLLTMRALTRAARAICYATAVALDRAKRAGDARPRKPRTSAPRCSRPVAKAFSTDIGNEVASLGVQVHGGMGYIEETGAAQHYRDARIAPIYEGTNGIQAIDLVTRKLPLSGGATVRALYRRAARAPSKAVHAANDPAFGATGVRLAEAVDSLERGDAWLLGRLDDGDREAALAGATPYLRLFGTRRRRRAAGRGGAGGGTARRRRGRCRPRASRWRASSPRTSRCRRAALERAVVEGADSVTGAEAALAG